MTTVLNAYSSAFPSITNRIRAGVFLESDPFMVLIASQIDSTFGHPIKFWTFAGLPRNNYGFTLDEIDGGGAVVKNLALFSVVPGQVDGQLVRDDEQIKVGTTIGFNTGANTFTFDGTGGKPDYRGWEIVPSELTGRGILVRDALDYTWDKNLGVFTLLQAGDIFPIDNYYNIHFNPIINPVGNSYPSLNDFMIKLITVDTTLLYTDFGEHVIVEPIANYLEITLPLINTVVIGRPITIETGDTGSMFCVKIKNSGADVIKWKTGSIYMCPNESLKLFRYLKPDTSSEWRLYDMSGNFRLVGQIVTSDDASGINVHLLNGAIEDKNQYARIYNEYILNLPFGQVVTYDNWTFSNNKYFYSLESAGNFYFPDRRYMFERNAGAGDIIGSFQGNTFKAHHHKLNGNSNGKTGGQGGIVVASYTGHEDINDINSGIYTMEDTGGTETRPDSNLINRYVLI